jgi:hypothetical protein
MAEIGSPTDHSCDLCACRFLRWLWLAKRVETD